MHAEDRVRLRHMIDAAEHAMQFVAGRQRVDLENDHMLLFALVRAIEVIGEAAGKISDETAGRPCRHSLESHYRYAQPTDPRLL